MTHAAARTLGAIFYDGFELLDLYGPLEMFGSLERSSRAELTLSVCSGSAILAKAGLLDGRRATSNKVFFSLATSQSDRVEWIEKARWVEDGPFFTSSGVSAGIDMSLAVIAKLYGRERAQLVADLTEYEWQTDPTRDPFHKFLNQGAARLAQLAK